MGRTVTYPDGSKLSSTALSKDEIQSIWQDCIAQMLGILVNPLSLNIVLTLNSDLVAVDNVTLLYIGEIISATGIPTETIITSVGPGNFITIYNPATQSGSRTATVTDPNAYSLVRVGWLTQGQPGIEVEDDVTFVRCETDDSSFSRMRNSVRSDDTPFINMTDVHTRSWRSIITVYGPNSLDNARLIRTALVDVPYFDVFLSDSNLYVNPNIEEPRRVPEVFQGQWWERVDIVIEFNEEVTEIFTVGTVETVVVTTFDKNGQLTTQTITV